MKQLDIHSRIKFHYHFSDDITAWLQEDMLTRTETNIQKFTDSYFKKILNKQDAEISITLHINKTKADKFEGKCHFVLDGETFDYHTDVPFSEPYDIISHAFKHVKEHLADHK